MKNVNIPHIALSGIYKITNTVTEEFYIGLSVDIFARWGSHYTNAFLGDHSSKKLESSIKQYGMTAFTFQILEVVSKTEHRKSSKLKGDDFDSHFRQVLLAKEKWWMSQHSVTFALNQDNKHFS